MRSLNMSKKIIFCLHFCYIFAMVIPNKEEKTVNKEYILAHNSICVETGAFKRIKDRGGRKID